MKLLIVDKDWTLVKPSVDGQSFVRYPQDQIHLPGVFEALQKYKSGGWAITIASNQGGIKAGYKSLEDAIDEMKYCLEIFSTEEWIIDRGVFCPDDGESIIDVQRHERVRYSFQKVLRGPSDKSFRKPASGMLEYLMKQHGSVVEDTLLVGDMQSDEEAAINAEIRYLSAEAFRERLALENEEGISSKKKLLIH